MTVASQKIELDNFKWIYDMGSTCISSLNKEKMQEKYPADYIPFSHKKGLPVKLADSWKLLDKIPLNSYLIDIFSESKIFWIIPLATPTGYIYGYILKALGKKIYRMYPLQEKIYKFFGFEDFIDYKKGEPIVLVEGCKDAIYLKQFYPYVLSINTARLNKESMKVISILTNRVILAYDNDDAGHYNTEREIKSLTKECVSVDTLRYKLHDPASYFNLPEEGLEKPLYNILYPF